MRRSANCFIGVPNVKSPVTTGGRPEPTMCYEKVNLFTYPYKLNSKSFSLSHTPNKNFFVFFSLSTTHYSAILVSLSNVSSP